MRDKHSYLPAPHQTLLICKYILSPPLKYTFGGGGGGDLCSWGWVLLVAEAFGCISGVGDVNIVNITFFSRRHNWDEGIVGSVTVN